MPRTVDILDILTPDRLATSLTRQFTELSMRRQNWLEGTREVRDYVFATDTGSTSNADLPWKNSTHVPKLCQIRDNLHANYMAALFPNDSPVKWEGDDETSEAHDKRLAIESYMSNKMRMGQFRTEVSKCVYDFIDYGNCFAMPEYIDERIKDPETGEWSSGYVGPRLMRISPLDIVFDPTANSFADTPKFIRSIRNLGTLKADIDDRPEMAYLEGAFDRISSGRHAFAGFSQGDVKKNSAFAIDGFSSYTNYMQSNYVELLDFYGDWFDVETGVFHKNVHICIADRIHIILNQPNPSWLGNSGICHAGWRLRADNLYAMGPLENLVGMQYRIDHLENAKADAFDLIIHPVMVVKGQVEDFEYGPGERIFSGDDGSVDFVRPDVTALNANNEIAAYQAQMEEMAGAPKQAMGFRTPGEKTAYEVQILENGSNRIFINKTSYFEEIFLEPLLNSMLELARRNLGPSDAVRVMDDQFGVVNFMQITKDDIVASGKLRPIGARHFARNANILQNLTQFAGSALGQNPAIQVHFSGKRIAHLVEQLVGLERFELVQDNIGVAEALETKRLQAAGSQISGEENGDPNLNPTPQAGATQGSQLTGAIPAPPSGQ